ncbi:MAG: hypothetical protein SGPRY_007444 [Prymnesium sp.]
MRALLMATPTPPRPDSTWGKFKALPARRRVLLGVSGMAVAILGLIVTPDEEASQKLVVKGLPGPLYVPESSSK